MEEAWGLAGTEGLIEKHLGDEDNSFIPDCALHFYRRMHKIMEGEYALIVDIDESSDVVNIRINRPDMEELHYPNRFMLFESIGWWLKP